MKKPVTIIACKDSEEGKKIANSVENTSKDTGIGWETKLYEDRTHIGKGGQLYIATDLDQKSSQHDLANKLKEKEVPCARLFVTSADRLIDQHRRYSGNWFRSLLARGKLKKASLLKKYFVDKGKEIPPERIDWGDFKNWLVGKSPFHDVVIEDNKHPLDSEMKKAIEYVRQKRKMCKPLRIGVLGLGKLGGQILHDLKSAPYIESVHAFSEFAKLDYERKVISIIGFEGDQRRNFHFHEALEELVEANPDLLIVSTGEHGVQYEKYDIINNLTERLMKGSYPKVKKILEVVKRYQDKGVFNGIVSMESNSTGPLLQIAKSMRIDPLTLTSITPDMSRHKTLLLYLLSGISSCKYEKLLTSKQKHREPIKIEYGERDAQLQYSDICLDVIGEHGKEIPLLREAKVKGKPLVEVFPEFNEYKYRRAFIDVAREIGLKLMKIAKNSGKNYGGTPDKIVEQVEKIAFLGREISSAYSYFPDADCFVGAPSVIDHPLRIRSVADSIDDLSQDEEVISELREHIEYQKTLASKYHKTA